MRPLLENRLRPGTPPVHHCCKTRRLITFILLFHPSFPSFISSSSPSFTFFFVLFLHLHLLPHFPPPSSSSFSFSSSFSLLFLPVHKTYCLVALMAANASLLENRLRPGTPPPHHCCKTCHLISFILLFHPLLPLHSLLPFSIFFFFFTFLSFFILFFLSILFFSYSSSSSPSSLSSSSLFLLFFFFSYLHQFLPYPGEAQM